MASSHEPALADDPGQPGGIQPPDGLEDVDIDDSPPMGNFMVLAETMDPLLTVDEKRQVRIAAYQLIRERYNGGVKLFTKDLFRDVVRVFDSAAADSERDSSAPRPHVVSVTGLDGVVVDFPIQIGEVYPFSPFGSNAVCVKTKPQLHYNTIESLLHDRDIDVFSISRAFLPVEVCHATEFRHPITGERVEPWPNVGYDVVKHRFDRARQTFEASNRWETIKTHLSVALGLLGGGANFEPGDDGNGHVRRTNPASRGPAPTATPVRNIVAFALSTMSVAENRYDMAETSATQHAMLVVIRDFFQDQVVVAWRAGAIRPWDIAVAAPSTTTPTTTTRTTTINPRDLETPPPPTSDVLAGHPAPFPCIVQDPVYTPVDKQVLAEAGITVVDDPRAFLAVDEASVLVSINPDVPVRQIVADIARPAVMVWNRVYKEEAAEDGVLSTDPASQRVLDMIEEYIELPFPARIDDEHFSGDLAIYIRKDICARGLFEDDQSGI
ncbi:hypothetical protein VTJ49DRAFT_6001 [Mycothermus thermophilus]|uniref:SRR1-like domain-containing protein n=1 Tax=Humicola insolens TaxID=85995 RepID=A0ABR3VK57_HUMIN